MTMTTTAPSTTTAVTDSVSLEGTILIVMAVAVTESALTQRVRWFARWTAAPAAMASVGSMRPDLTVGPAPKTAWQLVVMESARVVKVQSSVPSTAADAETAIAG